MSIGENIKRRREEAGLTQDELAASIFVTQSMLSQIERGTKTPTLPLSAAIADKLGCTVMDFLAG